MEQKSTRAYIFCFAAISFFFCGCSSPEITEAHPLSAWQFDSTIVAHMDSAKVRAMRWGQLIAEKRFEKLPAAKQEVINTLQETHDFVDSVDNHMDFGLYAMELKRVNKTLIPLFEESMSTFEQLSDTSSQEQLLALIANHDSVAALELELGRAVDSARAGFCAEHGLQCPPR